MNTTTRTASIALLMAMAAGLAWNIRQVRFLRQELAGLRHELHGAASTRPVEPGGEQAQLRPPDTSAELVALRGELAALRRAIESRPAPVRPDKAAGERTASGSVLPPHVRRGWIEAAGIPAAVSEAFRQQLGDLAIDGAHVKQSEGVTYFSVDTRLPDGRGIELAVDDAGVIRHRHLETPFETLDPVLQQAATGEVGDTPIRAAAEIYEDGQTRYRVTAKSPEQGIQVVLAPDGTVLRTEISRPEKQP